MCQQSILFIIFRTNF